MPISSSNKELWLAYKRMFLGEINRLLGQYNKNDPPKVSVIYLHQAFTSSFRVYFKFVSLRPFCFIIRSCVKMLLMACCTDTSVSPFWKILGRQLNELLATSTNQINSRRVLPPEEAVGKSNSRHSQSKKKKKKNLLTSGKHFPSTLTAMSAEHQRRKHLISSCGPVT